MKQRLGTGSGNAANADLTASSNANVELTVI